MPHSDSYNYSNVVLAMERTNGYAQWLRVDELQCPITEFDDTRGADRHVSLKSQVTRDQSGSVWVASNFRDGICT